MSRLTDDGKEVVDSTPLELPLGYQHPPTLNERIAQALRAERFRQDMIRAGVETFEEAEDFDCGEDDPLADTPYELEFDPGLGKEIPRQEKAMLDAERRRVDAEVAREKKKRWFGFGRERSPEGVQERKEGSPRKAESSSERDRSNRSFTQEEPRQREEE